MDAFDVVDGLDSPADVDHAIVVKTAHDVGQCIGLADISKELVAQTLPLGGPGDESRDIDEFHDGWDDPLRVYKLGQLHKARIGNLDHPDIRLDRAERIVL